MITFSKILMSTSAVLYLFMGLGISFFPQDTGIMIGTASQYGMDLLVMNILGALFVGFGILNYTGRGAALDGVYGRAIVLANMIMALVTGGQLLKFIIGSSDGVGGHIWLLCILFLIIAAGFLTRIIYEGI